MYVAIFASKGFAFENFVHFLFTFWFTYFEMLMQIVKTKEYLLTLDTMVASRLVC